MNKLSSRLHHFPLLAAQLLHHFTPLKKLHSHSYTIFPMAAFLLVCFNPSEQIIPSILHHFTPSGSPALTSFTPREKNSGSSPFNSLYPLWSNNHLALTPFFHPWQLNSYIILPTLNNYHPPTQTPLYPLRQLNSFSLYPLWTNYTLTLTPLYPP